jgi:hypothetical protein
MDSIKCKYVFDKNYNPVYINGASGGVTPRGEIIANFFLERHGLPFSQTYSVKDNKLDKTIDIEPADFEESLVRFVDNGIVMNIDTAKEIRGWLDRMINMLENPNL